MNGPTPAERTAATAKILLTAGTLFAGEAVWQGSIARTFFAMALLASGGLLLAHAKRPH